eukprot:g1199.t1
MRCEVPDEDSSGAWRLWTRPDCEGTPHATPYRTWFYFQCTATGAAAGRAQKFVIMNLNKQKGLYTHGYKPMVKAASWAKWQRSTQPCTFVHVDGCFELSFSHDFSTVQPGEPVRFAFCYPLPYDCCQRRLEYLDRVWGAEQPSSAGAGGSDARVPVPWEPAPFDVIREAPGWCTGAHLSLRGLSSARTRGLSDAGAGPGAGGGGGGAGATTAAATAGQGAANNIYYHRELLTQSLGGRRVDLITLTSRDGQLEEREEAPPELPSLGAVGPRPHRFEGKPVVFISARVHPGETPASFCFAGVLGLLLRPADKDPRAAELRRQFVFKLVPILNPDGVGDGHYRADTLGVNLNRCYAQPTLEHHPSIHAVKSIVAQHHREGRLHVYLDMHAHASKRGCFLYGNKLDSLNDQVDNLLFARLVAVNSPFLDFDACNFTEKNMHAEDRRGGPETSKEGSGRVAVFRLTGIKHSYTLECNYNEGRHFPPPADAGTGGTGAGGRSSTLPAFVKYDTDAWIEIGQACALAILDLSGANRWSLLPRTQYHSLEGARQALWSRLRNSCPAYRNTLGLGSNDGGGGNVMGVRSEAWSTGRSREVLRLTGARSLGARTEDATLAKARARSHGELANP